ncbi:MAG: DUF3789 domain-containing protein [Lachnospiraceae bacterium]
MSEFIFFIIGTTLGGLVGVVLMCCLQINRLSQERGCDQCENEMCRYSLE